jgi:sugar-specific transcriptional regulator TrmB
LTLNQAKVYLAVIKLEKTTVVQVANFSKVRREDVYRILPSLEKMGLVERLLGKPTEIPRYSHFGCFKPLGRGRKRQI